MEEIIKKNEVADNNKNSSKKGIIAILIAIIIALMGVVIYFAYVKKDNSTTDNNDSSNQENNNVNENTKIKGDLILVGDDGYYVSYMNGGTRLFDKDNNELALLANKKISINSITGFWDIDDEANVLYIGVNLAYEDGKQYCVDNDKEVASYSYYLSSGKVTFEKEGVCKNNLIK